jgi:hypothetical protein
VKEEESDGAEVYLDGTRDGHRRREHSPPRVDVPYEALDDLAATQRPAAAAAFSDASGPPAWKRLPSWAVVATGDKAAGSDVVGSMARRAGADIVEVEGSHVIMVSQPQAVTDLILKAAQAVVDSHR